MTITIFEDKNCRGARWRLTGDIRDLKNRDVDKPSSIALSSANDHVLLFKNDDWRGSVFYLRGARTVSDLGKKDKGGRRGFGNSIRSIRCTPFQLDLNVTIVSNSQGDYPGNWTSSTEAERDIETIVALVNDFYTVNRALLHLRIVLSRPRVSNPKFVIKAGGANYPDTWKRSGTVDVVFVDSFKKDHKTGRAKPPMFGQTLTISARNFGKGRTLENMARSLAHEMGHYLGIHHPSANGNAKNLMFRSGSTDESISDRFLRSDQIEEMHKTLSKNLARRGDRN